MYYKPISELDVIIRSATFTDEPIVYEFLCELEKIILDRMAFTTIFNQNLSDPAIHYLVAEKQGEVIGFVSCHIQWLLHHVGRVGEVQELFVRSDVRNQQVGHQLLAALNAFASREKPINLEVTTNQKRMDTIRFYEREGFIPTHIKLVKPIQF